MLPSTGSLAVEKALQKTPLTFGHPLPWRCAPPSEPQVAHPTNHQVAFPLKLTKVPPYRPPSSTPSRAQHTPIGRVSPTNLQVPQRSGPKPEQARLGWAESSRLSAPPLTNHTHVARSIFRPGCDGATVARATWFFSLDILRLLHPALGRLPNTPSVTRQRLILRQFRVCARPLLFNPRIQFFGFFLFLFGNLVGASCGTRYPAWLFGSTSHCVTIRLAHFISSHTLPIPRPTVY